MLYPFDFGPGEGQLIGQYLGGDPGQIEMGLQLSE